MLHVWVVCYRETHKFCNVYASKEAAEKAIDASFPDDVSETDRNYYRNDLFIIFEELVHE